MPWSCSGSRCTWYVGMAGGIESVAFATILTLKRSCSWERWECADKAGQVTLDPVTPSQGIFSQGCSFVLLSKVGQAFLAH
jgi:hypothetical protein